MEMTSTNADGGLAVVFDLSVHPEPDLPVSTAAISSAGFADDVELSTSSDRSDSKPPRSAMRRSSSTIPKTPQSPRRVRFDFMGEEVLPTSSPQPTAFISTRIPSPDPFSDEAHCASHLATELGEEEDDDDDVQAPPRKVSSSDALRALSRAPLDEDGTVWTVVNSDLDDIVLDQPHSLQVSQRAEPAPTAATAVTAPSTVDWKPTSTVTTAELSQKAFTTGHFEDSSPSNEEDFSDDDFLAMPSTKPYASSVSRTQALLLPTETIQQVMPGQTGDRSGAPTRAKQVAAGSSSAARQEVSVTKEDETELFHFEEEGLQLPERPPQAQSPAEQNELDDGHSDHDEESSGTSTTQRLSLYATSPAVPITRPVNRDREQEPPTPSRGHFEPNTVGSYKGRPLTMPIMRNPDILSQLESAKPINEVVGSVHHRGPTDAFNPVSFQESAEQILAFSAPRSFSQRLMMEDMMEAAKGTSPKSGPAPTMHGQ
ncbi:hypothetical protein ED733_005324 [Metarhizium rileyi]|uniref:Uncharacterized protein n=1 Tax=Metarhizium rileyi (strain RCEF 4871) TaxID=1649241 RepID=A0A5C6GIX3_METRR|nr:hypothetical protein ED733_005324 [Metarhizium rileyi]